MMQETASVPPTVCRKVGLDKKPWGGSLGKGGFCVLHVFEYVASLTKVLNEELNRLQSDRGCLDSKDATYLRYSFACGIIVIC
jgi:hypothetical protein